MSRVMQSAAIGIPALVAVFTALFGAEWSSDLLSARTWIYVTLSAIAVVAFWNFVNRVYLPENQPPLGIAQRPRWFFYGLAVLSFGLPLVVMVVTVVQPWWDPGDLLRDPLNVAQQRMTRTGSVEGCCGSEVGAVSLLGNLITTGAAAIMGFAGIQRALEVGKWDGGAVLLLLGAFLAGVMALDDLFRFHETHQRKFIVFYMTVLGAVACLSVLWLSWFENGFLLATAGFFVASIVVDTVFEHNFGEYRVVIEDAAKLFGLCCLACYALTAGLRLSGVESSRSSGSG